MLADPRKAIYTLNDWFIKELKDRNKDLLILSNDHHLGCACLEAILSKSNTKYQVADQLSNASDLYAQARKFNGLVVGNDNKLDFFTRTYSKEDTADLYPFYELTEQDIWDILC